MLSRAADPGAVSGDAAVPAPPARWRRCACEAARTPTARPLRAAPGADAAPPPAAAAPPAPRPVPQPAPAPPGRYRPAASRGGVPQRSAGTRPFCNFYYRCISNPSGFRLAESSQLKAPEPRPPGPGGGTGTGGGGHRPPSTRSTAASPRSAITVPCTCASARRPEVRSGESRLKVHFSKRKGSTQQQLSAFPRELKIISSELGALPRAGAAGKTPAAPLPTVPSRPKALAVEGRRANSGGTQRLPARRTPLRSRPRRSAAPPRPRPPVGGAARRAPIGGRAPRPPRPLAPIGRGSPFPAPAPPAPAPPAGAPDCGQWRAAAAASAGGSGFSLGAVRLGAARHGSAQLRLHFPLPLAMPDPSPAAPAPSC